MLPLGATAGCEVGAGPVLGSDRAEAGDGEVLPRFLGAEPCLTEGDDVGDVGEHDG